MNAIELLVAHFMIGILLGIVTKPHKFQWMAGFMGIAPYVVGLIMGIYFVIKKTPIKTAKLNMGKITGWCLGVSFAINGFLVWIA